MRNVKVLLICSLMVSAWAGFTSNTAAPAGAQVAANAEKAPEAPKHDAAKHETPKHDAAKHDAAKKKDDKAKKK